MNNLRFLKEILTSNCEYWIALRQEGGSIHVKRPLKNTVWFICIPYSVELNKNADEILLKDIEALQYVNIDNVPLTEDYAPFQRGLSLYNFQRGFPVPQNVNKKEFLKLCLENNSDSLEFYKSILDKILNPAGGQPVSINMQDPNAKQEQAEPAQEAAAEATTANSEAGEATDTEAGGE